MARSTRQVMAVRRSARHLRPRSVSPPPPKSFEAPVPSAPAEPSRPVTRSQSRCSNEPRSQAQCSNDSNIPRPTKRRRTTSYTAANSSKKPDHNKTTTFRPQDAFPLLQLPEDLLQEVLHIMWSTSDPVTKHNMRMVCHKFCSLTSALACKITLPLHAFTEFVDNKTRRSPFMLRLPSTFPNLNVLALENGLPDFMQQPVSTSRCRQAARLFLSKVVCNMPKLQEIDLKNWPGRRLSQADVQLLVRVCPGLRQLKLMTYDDMHTLCALANLSSLQHLYIVRSPDQDEDMVALAGFTQLTSLHLGFITEEQNVIASMRQLTSLVSFNVDILLLRDQAAASMGQLRSLTRLHLGILSPDEASVDFSNSLRALTNLQDVLLRQYTGCCNSLVIEALGSLPKLRTLQMNPSQYVHCNHRITPFRMLTKLELSRTTIDAQTLIGIGLGNPLPRLQQLTLQSCKILYAQDVLSVISKQVQLQYLTIHEVDDSVSKTALMQLTCLKGLQQLYFVSKHQAQLPDADAQQVLLDSLPQLSAGNAYKFSYTLGEHEPNPNVVN